MNGNDCTRSSHCLNTAPLRGFIGSYAIDTNQPESRASLPISGLTTPKCSGPVIRSCRIRRLKPGPTEAQNPKFPSAKGAANKKRQNHVIPLPFERGTIGNAEQFFSLFPGKAISDQN